MCCHMSSHNQWKQKCDELSFFQGYSQPNQYIASSGPKESTTYDFWRMVWERRVTCIVMVTKCVEEGKVCYFFGSPSIDKLNIK